MLYSTFLHYLTIIIIFLMVIIYYILSIMLKCIENKIEGTTQEPIKMQLEPQVHHP